MSIWLIFTEALGLKPRTANDNMANFYNWLITCSGLIGPLDSESPRYEGVLKNPKKNKKR